VLEAINVRVAPGRILIPDLVVVTRPGLDRAVWDPVEVAMVVEIVSPGSVAADRAIKPQLYAAAGIEHYLRIELGGSDPSGAAYRLHRGHYVKVTSSESGQVLCLAEPFKVDLDFAQLATATHQGDSHRSPQQFDGDVERAVDVESSFVPSDQREFMGDGSRADECVIDRPTGKPAVG
jgi:hypothetical protein